MAYQAMGSLMSTASAASAIATDPHLPKVVYLVLKLKSIEEEGASNSRSGSTGAGVGLRNVVGPLNTFVDIQASPWILPLVATGVFGAIFAAGYLVRKVSRG